MRQSRMRDRPHSFFCSWEKSMPIRIGRRRNLRIKGNAPCTKVQPTNVRRNVVPWFVEKGIGSEHYNQRKWIPLPRSRIKETINIPVTTTTCALGFRFSSFIVPVELCSRSCQQRSFGRFDWTHQLWPLCYSVSFENDWKQSFVCICRFEIVMTNKRNRDLP